MSGLSGSGVGAGGTGSGRAVPESEPGRIEGKPVGSGCGWVYADNNEIHWQAHFGPNICLFEQATDNKNLH
ncbi:MAG: hypothetical protein BroJett011_64720 [Chloroflexota bacterium]|nr:MAG: hypothetical protein BroJett011_64720 [Chloroflexota bacterium]